MTTAARVIHSDPDILGVTPVVVGTRVPVKTLLDYLEAGDPLDEFLDHFPSVSREQAIAVKCRHSRFPLNQAHIPRATNDFG